MQSPVTVKRHSAAVKSRASEISDRFRIPQIGLLTLFQTCMESLSFLLITLRLPPRLLVSLTQYSDMTYQDPHPSVPAHADATAPQRLEPTMLSPSKLRHFMMRQENTESEGTLAATSGEFHWMTYRPERSTVGDSYNSFLDELGFTSKDASKRSAFVDQFKDYVDSSTFRYVRQHENEVQFKNMVLDFLRVFGLKYWGPNDRHHLQERDPAKGFLCPRDANRSSSRYDGVLLGSEHARYSAA